MGLARRPAIVRIQDLDEARELYSRMSLPVHVDQAAGRRFSWEASYASLGTLRLSAHRFGDGFVAESAEASDVIVLSIPVGSASCETTFGKHVVPLIPGHAAGISRAGETTRARMDDGYASTTINIPGAALREAALALDGVLLERLTFAPRIDLSSRSGRALLHSFERTFAAARTKTTASVAESLVEALLFDLLVTQPRDGVSKDAPGHSAEPRSVKRALDYLSAHSHEPIRMAHVAEAAGTSVRMLQNGFLAHRGQSMRHALRALRLANARRTCCVMTSRRSHKQRSTAASRTLDDSA